jgi:hypothetical protein
MRLREAVWLQFVGKMRFMVRTLKLTCITLKYQVRTSQRTQCASIRKTIHSILHREIMAVFVRIIQTAQMDCVENIKEYLLLNRAVKILNTKPQTPN